MKGAGLAIIALVAVGVIAVGAVAATRGGVAAPALNALKKLLAGKLHPAPWHPPSATPPSRPRAAPQPTPRRPAPRPSTPSVTTTASTPSSTTTTRDDEVRVCWAAGGFLDVAYGYGPSLWIQTLKVSLDGRVIFRYSTSGNGMARSECMRVPAGRHTMVATYSTIDSSLYVWNAWLGIDTHPHLAGNGMPYPGAYAIHRTFDNSYAPDTSIHRVTITITFTASDGHLREVRSGVSTG